MRLNHVLQPSQPTEPLIIISWHNWQMTSNIMSLLTKETFTPPTVWLQVVRMSVNVTTNCPSQDYTHLDDIATYDARCCKMLNACCKATIPQWKSCTPSQNRINLFEWYIQTSVMHIRAVFNQDSYNQSQSKLNHWIQWRQTQTLIYVWENLWNKNQIGFVFWLRKGQNWL